MPVAISLVFEAHRVALLGCEVGLGAKFLITRHVQREVEGIGESIHSLRKYFAQVQAAKGCGGILQDRGKSIFERSGPLLARAKTRLIIAT